MNDITRQDIRHIERLIAVSKRIVTITHMHPDGDAVGSSIAVASYLRSIGKDATMIFPNDIQSALSFLMNEKDAGKHIVHEHDAADAEKAVKECDLLFCLDFNSYSRVGGLESALTASRATKVLIDHHPNPDLSCFSLAFSETEISSTSELVYYILMAMPGIGNDAGKLRSITATACLTGMTTDTNNFANSVFPSTFKMASELIASGTDRDSILAHLYNEYREERLRLMGELLHNGMKITEDGVAYMILDKETIEKYNIKDGETEGFVNIPLSISTVRMSIFLKEDKDRFRVSLRSKKGVSANKCAALYFNGGGHELASGGRLMIPDDVNSREDAAIYIEQVTSLFFNNI